MGMINSLSGRFLILTTVFVILAEGLILFPSVSAYRHDYLQQRLERAQIASLAVLADEMIDAELERELLNNAGVYNVVLRRDAVRQLALSSPIPEPVFATYDLRGETTTGLIADAIATLRDPEDRIIRVIGQPVQGGGLLIEVTMEQGPLREAMWDYGLRVLTQSALVAVVLAALLFFAVRRLIVRPITGVVRAMESYAEAPEDARRLITPHARIREIRLAEEALAKVQTQLSGALRQKERLAQLGGAVAKVAHDLRNILTSAQLFADRLEGSDDPLVARMGPKLVGSITRAVHLTESTLAFGRAEEPPPRLVRLSLAALVDDVIEGERLASGEHDISFSEDVPALLTIRADAEQMHRVIQNLVRNARQAIIASGEPGEIAVQAAEEEDAWVITIKDTGPGLPQRAQDHLFQPFQGGTRRGGAGLGLTIAAELVRGHGGRLELAHTGPDGTAFTIRLPRSDAALDDTPAPMELAADE